MRINKNAEIFKWPQTIQFGSVECLGRWFSNLLEQSRKGRWGNGQASARCALSPAPYLHIFPNYESTCFDLQPPSFLWPITDVPETAPLLILARKVKTNLRNVHRILMVCTDLVTQFAPYSRSVTGFTALPWCPRWKGLRKEIDYE